ncbi:MAG: cytochrome c biogenesis protein CcsA, partial [Candidatus Poseidoniaceae archaeon]
MWEATLWIACLAAIVLFVQPSLYEKSVLGAIAAHVCLALPFFALVSRFIVNDTSIQYVVAFGGESLPFEYRFAATWAAREGPILMWVVWLSLLSWIWRKPMQGKTTESTIARDFRQRIMFGFSLTLLLIAIVLNPFKETPEFFFGSGLNELLQTDLMVIHPPIIFLAYSFCIFITAISLSGIFTKETEGIGDRIIALTRPGLLITTIGIGLGGLWAYLILDWGGYWAWDPVETGSFLPWLALVGVSHLRTRPGKVSDKGWIGAGLVVGALALFATLVTRAGGVWASSVHTFVTSDSGTAPADAFSRMMLLKNDSVAGVEIMTYLMFILLIIG